MAKTLVHVVKEIEDSPEYATREDKDNKIKEEFERLSESNPVIDEVMNDRTTFQKEYKTILESMNSEPILKSALLLYWTPQDLINGIRHLEMCVGRLPLHYKTMPDIRYVANDPVLSAISWTILPFIPNILKGNLTLTRRDLLAKIPWMVGGAAIGGASAIYSKRNTNDSLVELEKNARHLDEVYARLYGKTSELKEPSALATNYFRRFGISHRT